MSGNDSSKALTKLLLIARAQHLRLTLETLPAGLIEVTDAGLIESIDDWTKQILGVKCKDLLGTPVTSLLEDNDSGFDLLERMQKKRFGRVGQVLMKTASGVPALAELVLEPSMHLHKFVFSLIFTV